MSEKVQSIVSEQAVSGAVERFTAVLGGERVLTSEAELREFRDPSE
jgi:hypothetical protein